VPFLTESAALAAVGVGRTAAAVELARLASTASPQAKFDFFLSHSYQDAELILGVRNILMRLGFKVYVDWVDDAQLDRERVTRETADLLRMRMRSSSSLVYVATSASQVSRWMPWELGYFDGFRPEHVAILPIVRTSTSRFEGQEYLKLYPYVEDVNFLKHPNGLGIRTGPGRAVRIETFAASGVQDWAR
jgi:hypothetical protein